MKNKQCINCHKTYVISDKDEDFYQRIGVLEPTHCPDCRKQRRLAYKNDFSLYQTNCQLCKKQIITMYDPQSGYNIYCLKCYWSDQVDNMKFGVDYNFNKSFFQQFYELQKKVPRVCLVNNQAENSDFCNFADRNKNCYMMSTGNDNEDCYFGYYEVKNKNCLDVLYTVNSQYCFECIDCDNCYEVRYSQLSNNCMDSEYLYDCNNCQHCIGCVGLKNVEYNIFNKSYTEEEYKLRKKSLYPKNIIDTFNDLKTKYPRKYIIGKKYENCTGDRIFNCQNVFNSYDIHDSQNCNYMQDGLNARDSYDVYGFDGIELCYETLSAIGYNFLFSYYCRNSQNLTYCDSCHSCKNCFACIGLRHKEFCIFNKQYSESEYNNFKNKIIEQMTKAGEWCEALPLKNSPFAYNESLANSFYPLSKKACQNLDLRYKEQEENKNIGNKDLIDCKNCHKNFKIIPQEEKFYQQYNIKKPQYCFMCRHNSRLQLRNPATLWHRQCMCIKPSHGHSGVCKNFFETSYAPERKELIYCEDCYNKEIY